MPVSSPMERAAAFKLSKFASRFVLLLRGRLRNRLLSVSGQ